MSNHEKVKNSISEPKNISRLCTFKSLVEQTKVINLIFYTEVFINLLILDPIIQVVRRRDPLSSLDGVVLTVP
jgi:hypothetical protein